MIAYSDFDAATNTMSNEKVVTSEVRRIDFIRHAHNHLVERVSDVYTVYFILYTLYCILCTVACLRSACAPAAGAGRHTLHSMRYTCLGFPRAA